MFKLNDLRFWIQPDRYHGNTPYWPRGMTVEPRHCGDVAIIPDATRMSVYWDAFDRPRTVIFPSGSIVCLVRQGCVNLTSVVDVWEPSKNT